MKPKRPTLDDLARLVLKFRKDRDWEQFHNPKDMAIGLTLEAAELLELVHWKTGDELTQSLEDKRGDLADELADILGWVLLFAHDHKIDLAAAFGEKMKKNEKKYPVEKARGTYKKYTEL